jgi:hypothetical protein
MTLAFLSPNPGHRGVRGPACGGLSVGAVPAVPAPSPGAPAPGLPRLGAALPGDCGGDRKAVMLRYSNDMDVRNPAPA